eukprot:COSAG05_NODE_15824_length_360_cov_0.793103_1_plen_66_part_10
MAVLGVLVTLKKARARFLKRRRVPKTRRNVAATVLRETRPPLAFAPPAVLVAGVWWVVGVDVSKAH